MKEDVIKKAIQRANSYLPNSMIDLKSTTPFHAMMRVYLSMLQDSAGKVEALPNKHTIAFFNLLEATYKPALPLHSSIQFFLVPESTGTRITKGTKVQSQSEDGTLLTLALQDDVYVSNASISDIYCANEKGKIISCYKDYALRVFDFTESGQQKYAITFRFPYLLEESFPTSFYLHFLYSNLPANKLMTWLCRDEIRWYASSNDTVLFPLECRNKEESIEITIKEKYMSLLQDSSQPIDITVMNEDPTNKEEQYFDGLQVSCHSHSYFADYVYVGEVPEDTLRFLPFTKELEPFTSCYIAFNKVLCKKEANIVLHWHVAYQDSTLNPFEVATKEYHMIMRSLPEEPLKIHDVYPDIVVFEYFNGEEWTIIPESKKIKEQFYSTLDREMNFTFICPNNISKVMVEGVEAYWLRLRLLQCNQRYQYPCCLHVPIIENMHASYQYTKDILPINKFEIYHQLDKEDALSKLQNQETIIPFKSLSLTHQCMYWYLDNPVIEDPFTIYLQLSSKRESTDTYVFYGSSEEGFTAIQVEDETDGFMHSGILRFYFHHKHSKMTLFNQEGYWIKIERCCLDLHPYPITIEKIICNVVKVREENVVSVTGNIESYQEDFIYPFDTSQVYDVFLSMYEVDVLGSGKWQSWFLQGHDTYRSFYLEEALLRVPINAILQGNVQKYQITYRKYEDKQQHILKDSEIFLVEDQPFIDRIISYQDSYGSLPKETTSQAIERMQHTLQYHRGVITHEDLYSYFKSEYRNIVDLKMAYHQDVFGKPQENLLTMAILTDDFALGSPSLYDSISMYKQILTQSSFLCGRNIKVIFREPVFLHIHITLTVCVDKQDSIMVQKQLEEYFEVYFHPIIGRNHRGWKIGEYPQRIDIVEAVKSLHTTYIVKDCYIQCWYYAQGKKIVRSLPDIHTSMLGCIVFDEHTIKVVKEG